MPQHNLNFVQNNKEEINLSPEAFEEFSKRCFIYANEHKQLLIIDSIDFTGDNYFKDRIKEKSILEHPFIKNLVNFGNYDLYFHAAKDDTNFYQMEKNGSGGGSKKEGYSVSFKTHEFAQGKPSCKLFISPYETVLLKPNERLGYLEKPTKEQILATFQLIEGEDKKNILINLMLQKRMLVPLKFREEPEYLFKIDDTQYVWITNKGDGYNFHVKIGYKEQWKELPVKSVERYRDGGTTIIKFSSDIDYKGIYCPSPAATDKRPFIQQGFNKINLEEIDPSASNLNIIGITVEAGNPRPTLLSFTPPSLVELSIFKVKEKNLSTKSLPIELQDKCKL